MFWTNFPKNGHSRWHCIANVCRGFLFLTVEMVFCYQNCSDLLWEKIVLVNEKIFKDFEITRTICSNSGRSEQFLVTECFFLTCYLGKLEFNLGFRNMPEKLENFIAKIQPFVSRQLTFKDWILHGIFVATYLEDKIT